MADTFTLKLPAPKVLADKLADAEPVIIKGLLNRKKDGTLHAPKNWMKYAKALKKQPMENCSMIDLANNISVAVTGKHIDDRFDFRVAHYEEYATNLKADIEADIEPA